MTIIEIILIALGLSADAFAVSLSAGSSNYKVKGRSAIRLAFHFGLFQALMPIAGWYLGYIIAPIIETIDHWIAFFILSYIGIKMMISGMNTKNEIHIKNPSKGMTMVMLSVATSIDAFAVGFSLALLNLTVWYPSVIIGIVTLIISLMGIKLGNKLGEKFGKRMEIAGGIILMLIGIQILLSHLY